MIRTQYTTEDLKKLPLRAIVAFAARCARRVESLSQLPADHPQREARRVAIENAIRLAEEIARGSACASVEPVVQALDCNSSHFGRRDRLRVRRGGSRGSRPYGGNRLARSSTPGRVIERKTDGQDARGSQLPLPSGK